MLTPTAHVEYNRAVDGIAPGDQRELRDNIERAVRCARCDHTLTSEKTRIEVHGRNALTFMNASGVIFDVRLYADLPGAVFAGVPDAETSWFPGTAWTYAHCASCRGHVGWRYVDLGGGGIFHGLIADCIIAR